MPSEKISDETKKELKELFQMVSDFLSQVKCPGITSKCIKDLMESEQVATLQVRQKDLRRQAGELETTLDPKEVMGAKVRKFDTTHMDTLAEGNIEGARAIEQGKNQFLKDREKTISAIRDLNAQVQTIDEQLKALLYSTFIKSFEDIKTRLTWSLSSAVALKDRELAELQALSKEHNVKLTFNPSNDIRLTPDGKFKDLYKRVINELIFVPTR